MQIGIFCHLLQERKPFSPLSYSLLVHLNKENEDNTSHSTCDNFFTLASAQLTLYFHLWTLLMLIVLSLLSLTWLDYAKLESLKLKGFVPNEALPNITAQIHFIFHWRWIVEFGQLLLLRYCSNIKNFEESGLLGGKFIRPHRLLSTSF